MGTSPISLAVLASFNTDLVMRAPRRPRAGETLPGEFSLHLGGKGFNQAIAARRLGARVAVAGRVGDDPFGQMFLAALDREDIDRQAVATDPVTGTGMATVLVEPDGANSIVQDPRANLETRAADVERCADLLLRGAQLFLMQLETAPDATAALLHRARTSGVKCLLNPAPALAHAKDLLGLVDILVPNEIEGSQLTGIPADGIEAAFAMADALHARGPSLVVVTLGSLGAVAVDRDHRLHVPAQRVDTVDTVGAGDAFCAALAVRLAERAGVAEALRFAAAAGALATTRHGAEPAMPRRAEVEALLAI